VNQAGSTEEAIFSPILAKLVFKMPATSSDLVVVDPSSKFKTSGNLEFLSLFTKELIIDHFLRGLFRTSSKSSL
jgi:c-di-AMP phosphodiesterase-like protein